MIRPTFRTTRKLLAPRWLTSGEGELLGYALDLLKDAYAQRALKGLLIRFPQQDPLGTPAPADALAAMGRDRRVVKGFGESDESYARRLRRWLDDRRKAGNPFALMERLAEYTGEGCKFRTFDNTGNCFTRETDGSTSYLLSVASGGGSASTWVWDGDTSKWSRFWVVIYPPASLWTVGPNYGDGDTYGQTGLTWGATATPEQVNTIQRIVNDWKPAGTRCVNIIIAFDPNSFDPEATEPDGLWGKWSKNVGGVQVPSRLSTARYWSGGGPGIYVVEGSS